jgi:hypothetical protein
MKVVRYCLLGILSFAMLMMYNMAYAYSISDDLELKGEIQSRFSVRTADSKGFTSPEIAEGNLVQQRNLALIELNDVLSRPSETTPDLKFHIVGRFLYDGVYDYGPNALKELRETNKDAIDEMSKSNKIWECYLDYGQGPWFFRFGKQNLSFGETDIFQVLDRINPLDNTFGGTFEDLDSRRIPIWMIRGNYNFGKVGPVSSLTMEGFLNPGWTGQEVAPLAPAGTPYAYPSPPSSVPMRLHDPDTTFQNSRMGARVTGVVNDTFNISLTHFQTIVDTPSAVVTIDPSVTGNVAQDLSYKTEQVSGASMSFFEPHIEAIIRTEAAYFWDEPVFIPQINAPALFGKFVTGSVPEKDVIRYMVGLDKNFWFRLINDTSMINLYLQYFAESYQDYDSRMKIPVNSFPSGEFIKQPRYDQKLTLVTSTSYMSGTLTPQLAVIYDPRGAWLYIPSIEKSFQPWIFKLAYYGISGDRDVSVGILKDRPQVSFQATIVF